MANLTHTTGGRFIEVNIFDRAEFRKALTRARIPYVETKAPYGSLFEADAPIWTLERIRRENRLLRRALDYYRDARGL